MSNDEYVIVFNPKRHKYERCIEDNRNIVYTFVYVLSQMTEYW
jgi:hypothetical protein